MKPKVLIVEDNVLLAIDLAELVQRDLDAEAVVALSVQDALQAANQNVALAFLDVELPDGKSYPIARKLLTQGVPLVFISGNESASLPEDLKCIPFLPKPVVPGHLISLAKTLVGQSVTMDPPLKNGRPTPDQLTVSDGIWDVERLRFATEAAGVALWSWNVDTDKITLDSRACDLWGVPRGQIVTFEELSAKIHPADLNKVRAAFAATRERFGPYETDFRILLGNEVRWISARGRGDDQGIVGRIMYGVFIDVSVRRRAEEAREVITGEMHHRIKNLFSLASALAGIASRTTTTKEEMTRDLIQRLIALSEAHQLIRPDSTVQSSARELGDLLTVLLKPYLDGDQGKGRVKISVPAMLVGEHSATAIALVVHELATNSMKYGALSLPAGKLVILGTDLGEEVEIDWQESGGPPVVSPPQSAGFGSRLVMASVQDQLGGTITIDWRGDGVAVKLKLNKVRLGA